MNRKEKPSASAVSDNNTIDETHESSFSSGGQQSFIQRA